MQFVPIEGERETFAQENLTNAALTYNENVVCQLNHVIVDK